MSRAYLGTLPARLDTFFAASLPSKMEFWLARSRQRRVLGELAEEQDDHLLKDIGVSRDAARREAARWFWS
jgi:uncharacterized protein YjiS (DUF1127 family)